MVKYENPGGHAIVQLDFSLTYNSQRAYQQITRGLKTSIGRVTAATFDDNLFPGINSYNQGNPPAQGYNLGDSALRWKNLWVSGLLNVGRLTVDPGSAENGAIYYNTTDNAFRGYRNDAWTNLGIGWATSSANLYNTNSGNVGIGTAVLSYPFEVAKDGSVASGNWVNVASIRDSARNKGLGFGYDSSSQTAIITAFSSSAASNLAFWTYDSSAWGERVRITGAGNVGIGTAGHQTNKLQVNGDVIRF